MQHSFPDPLTDILGSAATTLTCTVPDEEKISQIDAHRAEPGTLYTRAGLISCLSSTLQLISISPPLLMDHTADINLPAAQLIVRKCTKLKSSICGGKTKMDMVLSKLFGFYQSRGTEVDLDKANALLWTVEKSPDMFRVQAFGRALGKLNP